MLDILSFDLTGVVYESSSKRLEYLLSEPNLVSASLMVELTIAYTLLFFIVFF